MADYTPTSDKVEAEVSGIVRLWRKYPKLRLCGILVLVTVVIVVTLHYAVGKAALARQIDADRSEINSLRSSLDQKNNEIMRFHSEIAQLQAEKAKTAAEMAPFVTATVLKYGNSTAENLKKLADEIESLRRDSVELSAQMASRRLSNEQKNSLIKLLTNDPGSIAIVSTLLDSESNDFADDFDSAFRTAGWQTLRIVNFTEQKYGVYVGTLEGTAKILDTERIAKAIDSVGVKNTLRTFTEYDRNRMSPYFEKGVLYLVVQRKPAARMLSSP